MRIVYNHKLGVAVQIANIKSIHLEGKSQRAILLNTPYGYKSPSAHDSLVWLDDEVIYCGDLPDCQKVAAGIMDFMTRNYKDHVLDVNDLLQKDGE